MSASIWQPGDISNLSVVTADNTVKTERLAFGVKGQVLCNITSFAYAPSTGSLEVFINGVRQQLNIDFTETSGSSFTLAEPLEDGDTVDVKGLIGSSGAQTAAASASQALSSATQAAAIYQNILGLSLPYLPLSFANGGFGASYANKTQAFTAISPASTKGDTIVSDGVNNIRVPVSTDGYVYTADSTQPSGVRWGYLPALCAKVINTPTANILLNYNVNYSYVTYSGAVLSLDVTGIPTSTILKIIGIASSSYTVNTTGGVQVNIPNNTDIALVNNGTPQGIWMGNVSYGKTILTLPGSVLIATYTFDANTILIITGNVNSGNTIYITPYNTATKTLGNTYTEASMGTASPFTVADTITYRLFPASATTFVLAYSSAASAAFKVYTLSAGTITAGNQVSPAAGVPSVLVQLSAIHYVAVGSSGNQPYMWSWLLSGTAFSSAYSGAILAAVGNCYGITALSATTAVAYMTETSASAHRAIPFTFTNGIPTIGATITTPIPWGGSPTYNSVLVPGTTDTGLLVSTVGGISSLCAVRVTANVASVGAVATSTVALGTPVAHFAGMSSRVSPLEIYNNFVVGTTIVFASTSGAQAVRVAGNAITLGNILGSASSRVFYSASTGKYYLVDNVGNTIKQLIPNAGSTALTYGPTLAATGISAANSFINEQVFNNSYYSYNAGTGVGTLLGTYPLVSGAALITAILNIDSRTAITSANTIIDSYV